MSVYALRTLILSCGGLITSILGEPFYTSLQREGKSDAQRSFKISKLSEAYHIEWDSLKRSLSISNSIIYIWKIYNSSITLSSDTLQSFVLSGG